MQKRLPKPLLVAMMLLLFSGLLEASGSREEKSGDKFYQYFDFANAVKSYEKAVKKSPENTSIKEKIATCYRLMNNTQGSEQWYGEVVKDAQSAPINKFYYAQALRSNEKYDEALTYYNQFKQSSKDPRPLDIINGYQYIQRLSAADPSIRVENLTEVNSPESDFSPMFYRDTAILFVSNKKSKGTIDNWTGYTFLDLYQSSKSKDGKMGKPTPFLNKKLNGAYHEGPVSFTKDYGVMYLTRSNYIKGNNAVKASDKKTVNLKIYRLNYEGNVDNWSIIQEGVPFNSNEYSVSHPAFSNDDNELYFVSDMPGGYGGTDVWVTKKQGTTWSTPVNLGPDINTAGDEEFPYMGKDGSLYYSSDGHYGLGGLDIYKTKKDKNGKWSKSTNLGAPFNSSKDDFGYIVSKDGQSGYFSSNRAGGLGDDDIYSWNNKNLKLIAKVIDAKTGEVIENADVKLVCSEEFKGGKKTNAEGKAEYAVTPDSKCTVKALKNGYKAKSMNVDIQNESKEIEIALEKDKNPEMKLEVLVIDKKTNQIIPGAIVEVNSKNTPEKVKAKTDKEGKMLLAGIQSNNEYYLTVNKETGDPEKKYLTVKQSVSTVGKSAPAYLKEIVYLELVEKGVAIKIDNIYYDLDKYYIRSDAAKELDKIVKVMQDNPTMEIELSSHTDCRSSYQYNMQLSAKRAESAVAYIASKGVSQKRMIAAGYGESRLVNNCKCEGTQVTLAPTTSTKPIVVLNLKY